MFTNDPQSKERHKAMAAHRAAITEKYVFKAQPLLRSPHIPTAVRALVMKTVAESKLLYGSEIWGMKAGVAKKAQAVLNKAYKWILGMSAGSSSTAAATMMAELGLQSVYAKAAARRTRAFITASQSPNSVIQSLIEQPMKARYSGTWVNGTGRWIKVSSTKANDTTDILAKTADSTQRYKLILGRVAATDKVKALKHKVTTHRYDAADFEDTRWSHSEDNPPIELALGLTALGKMRMGAFMDEKRLVKMKKTDTAKALLQLDGQCFCCGVRGGREIATHLLIRCQTWKEQRRQWLGPALSQINELWRKPKYGRRIPGQGRNTSNRTDAETYTLLLGGRVTRDNRSWKVQGWRPNSSFKRANDRNPEGGTGDIIVSAGEIHIRTHPRNIVHSLSMGARVAAFMTSILGKRQKILAEVKSTLPSQNDGRG